MDRRSFAPVFSLALLSLASLYGQSQPTGNWAIQCGLWRTDTSFNSTIQIKNRLVTEPVTVTPVLFMADGTEFDLPDVILPAAGVATVNVNSALANIQLRGRWHYEPSFHVWQLGSPIQWISLRGYWSDNFRQPEP